MTTRWTGAALAAALALGGAPALAQVTPDNFVGGKTSDLAALCAAGPSDPNVVSAVNFCHGFLLAVGQFHGELTQRGSRVGPLFCLPDPRPTVASITAAFVTWAGANPQYAGTSAAEGVVRFATSAYPCPRRPARRAS